MIILDKDNLSEVLASHKKVVVQFGASWCGNCSIVKPKFKALSQEIQDIAFVYVDAEEFEQSRDLADIKYLPTFAVYKDSELVSQKSTSNIEDVKELLNEITND